MLKEECSPTHGGIPGNDDAGTISAWYIFSAMGFYTDCPGTTRYSLGSPLFEQVVIHLNSDHYIGKRFTILAKNNSPENIYIQSGQLNDTTLHHAFITHN